MGTRTPQATIFLFLITLAIITPVGYAVNWSIDMRLTWNTAPDEMPFLLRTNDGRIWTFWQSKRTGNYDIFYKIYNAPNVHQWSPETRLTFNSNWDYMPSAMQASDGKIWLVWASNRTNGGFLYDIYYKIYDGSTWSADTQLTTSASNDEFPSIVQTIDGKIWVFWSSLRSGNEDIFYRTTTDNGAHWTADLSFPRNSVDPSVRDWDPAVMRRSNGNLWLFWVRSASSQHSIYYSVFAGSTWSAESSITGGSLEYWHPAATQTSDGKIWALWDMGSDTTTGDIYYKTWNGTWSSETQLTTHLDEDLGPSIAQDSQGNILIAWGSDRGSGITQPFDLFYRASSVSPTHDVELFGVVPNATKIVKGQNVAVEVVARNRGTSSESNMEVKCFVNSTLLGSKVLSLNSGELSSFFFTWFTSGFASANYTLSANITSVPGEVNLSDNTYVDGIVEIMKGPVAVFSTAPAYPQPNEMITFNATLSKPNGGAIVSYRWSFGDGNITVMSTPIVYHKYTVAGPYFVNLTVTDSQGLADSTWKTVVVAVHDVAVVGGSIADKVPWSQGIFCYVNVANQGDVEETVAVLVYFSDTFVGFEYVDVPQGTVAFDVPVWCDTSFVTPGSYSVKAQALTVAGERDLSDNNRTLGSVWVYVLDLSVVSVVPLQSRTYIGHTVNVNVEVKNEGTVDADAQLKLYRNNTLIEQRAIFLYSDELKTFEFLWNTSGVPPGKYELKAVVNATEAGFDELDTMDNVSTYNGVQVKIVGDVNGDGVINQYDLGEFAEAFGSTPGSSNWSTDSDIQKDNIVNVYDLKLIGRNYGNTSP